jgi:predicted nucleic acid-binding protein
VNLVISDASPLNYLVLIGRESVLPALYDKIMIPAEVLLELQDARAPELVRRWVSVPPSWLEVASPGRLVTLARPLDAGEHAAISLAIEMHADMILLDDSDARRAAAAMQLPFVGTLGVLFAAARRGFLTKQEAEAAVTALTTTNMRIKPRIVDEALAKIRAL